MKKSKFILGVALLCSCLGLSSCGNDIKTIVETNVKTTVETEYIDQPGYVDGVEYTLSLDEDFYYVDDIADKKEIHILGSYNGLPVKNVDIFYNDVVEKIVIEEGVTNLLELHKTAEVEVIGWSLGSAMAMLCSQDLNYNFGIEAHLFTFGSVNPFKMNIFNKGRTIKYLRSCCKSYHIFCNRNDIVTYLVPKLFGFRKLSRINVRGKFNFFGLFNVAKNHFIYDRPELYSRIYKKERMC